VFKFGEIIRRISRFGNWIGLIVLLLMMALVISNIVLRLFGGVITSTYELVGLMAAVAIPLCIVYATLEKTHIIVDLLLSRLSPGTQSVLESITSFIGLGTWGLIAAASIILTQKQWLLFEKTDILDIPIALFRCVWVFALILICLLLLVRISEVLSKAVKK
jgi:TRAP-type C4-dicarboxylate transport system permease small subunit